MHSQGQRNLLWPGIAGVTRIQSHKITSCLPDIREHASYSLVSHCFPSPKAPLRPGKAGLEVEGPGEDCYCLARGSLT